MKTFKEAHCELLIWRFNEEDKAEKIPNGTNGHDGLQEARRREIVSEYKKRYKDLKIKYEVLKSHNRITKSSPT